MQINKTILPLVFGLLIFQPKIYAQYSKHELGIEVGYGNSTLYGGSILDKYTSPTAISHVGLAYQLNFNRFIALRSGLIRETRGAAFQNVDWYGDWDYPKIGYVSTLIRNYYSMPILLRLSFGNKLQFFVNSGISGTISLTANITVKKNNVVMANNNYNLGEIQPDLTFVNGLGFSYRFSKRFGLSFEARDNTGIIVTEIDGSKTHSKVFLIALISKLNLK